MILHFERFKEIDSRINDNRGEALDYIRGLEGRLNHILTEMRAIREEMKNSSKALELAAQVSETAVKEGLLETGDNQ